MLRAQGCRRVDHHADAGLLGDTGVALQVEAVAEAGVRDDAGDLAGMGAQQGILSIGAHAPGFRIDVAEQRRQPAPQRCVRGGGKGKGRHQRKPPPRPPRGCLVDRDNQPGGGVVDGQAAADAAKKPVCQRLLELSVQRPVVGVDTRRFERLQVGDEVAQPGRARS